uniref:Secreted protein n=1 Tax=Meloidogyne incognita TaxID=6306 RepID=A0A914KIU5_MELIC
MWILMILLLIITARGDNGWGTQQQLTDTPAYNSTTIITPLQRQGFYGGGIVPLHPKTKLILKFTLPICCLFPSKSSTV